MYVRYLGLGLLLSATLSATGCWNSCCRPFRSSSTTASAYPVPCCPDPCAAPAASVQAFGAPPAPCCNGAAR